MEDLTTQHGFSLWLERERPALLRMAKSITRDEAEAEDVVQETSFAVWRRLQQGDIESPQSYLRRAVWVNAIKRRSRRRDWVPLEAEALARGGHPEPTAVQAPDLELAPWELEKALMDLPASQQAVIRLRYYGGLSFQETSEALSISINTAASRCRYALAALRLSIKSGEPFPKEANHGEPKPRMRRAVRRR